MPAVCEGAGTGSNLTRHPFDLKERAAHSLVADQLRALADQIASGSLDMAYDDAVQPGWRDRLLLDRYLPRMTVVSQLPSPERGGLAADRLCGCRRLPGCCSPATGSARKGSSPARRSRVDGKPPPRFESSADLYIDGVQLARRRSSPELSVTS